MDVHNCSETPDRLRQAIDAIPHQIWSAPADGAIDFCNSRWRSELGLMLDEIQANGWHEMLHPDDLERVVRAWQLSVTTGVPYEQEERHRMADGSFRWFLARGVPLRDEHGRICRWYGTNTDIEDLKRTQEALQRSETYLAEAQKLTKTGAYCINVNSRALYWSAETYRIFEYPQSIDVTLELALQRVHPEDAAVIRDVIDRALDPATTFDVEFRLLLPGDRIKHLKLDATRRNNEKGELELLGAVTDVSVTQRAFREIRALRDQLHRENGALKEEIDHASMFEEIVGSSSALQHVLVNLGKVAPTDTTVLITGASGTGKELVARAIHKRSRRAERAFVAVNCAAIPPALIASELFGHEKGAFTGAAQRRIGRFEVAHGGTLFLDEVGDLPMDSQLALLRVLQERQFERVGSNHPVTVDVRVIAASNRDLRAAVAAGNFREDLYYRLDVFPLAIPSLRERPNDIPLLLKYFVERYAAKAGRKFSGISPRTFELAQAYHWPGNIRELQNVIERGVILCEGLVFEIDESWLQCELPALRFGHRTLEIEMAETEARLIGQALQDSQGRISGPGGAADRLGIARTSLESRIKSLRINKHQFKRA